MIGFLADLTSRIDWIAGGVIWTALGVIATFTAVVVALQPTFRAEKRRKAEARMLRARLTVEFKKVRPSP